MFDTSNKLYDNIIIENKNLLKLNVDGLAFVIGKDWRRIGVNLSGSADSAIVTAILCKLIQENNLQIKISAISFIRRWDTRPWQAYIAEQVFQELKRMYPEIIEDQHWHYLPPELESGAIGEIITGRGYDAIAVASFNRYISKQLDMDAVVNATSMAPTGIEINKSSENFRNKTATQGTSDDLIYCLDGIWYMYPLRFVTKNWVIQRYFNAGLRVLFNKTRSCKADVNDSIINPFVPSYDDYKPGQFVPVCGKCWWCLAVNSGQQ